MSSKEIKFGDKEVNKKEFYSSKQATPFFFYKHNNYKHIEAEISEKSKHIVSIF